MTATQRAEMMLPVLFPGSAQSVKGRSLIVGEPNAGKASVTKWNGANRGWSHSEFMGELGSARTIFGFATEKMLLYTYDRDDGSRGLDFQIHAGMWFRAAGGIAVGGGSGMIVQLEGARAAQCFGGPVETDQNRILCGIPFDKSPSMSVECYAAGDREMVDARNSMRCGVALSDGYLILPGDQQVIPDDAIQINGDLCQIPLSASDIWMVPAGRPFALWANDDKAFQTVFWCAETMPYSGGTPEIVKQNRQRNAKRKAATK